ncbi:MAG: methyltransferase domain-containing protein [Planctomycetes bacterium]|nr:methyltransferase domain-containing protein [Planctomycetota bacterium]
MRDALCFFGQMAAKWRETGAIAPSGPHLAKIMARTVGPLAPNDVVVELGPGTGAFTKALVKHFPNNRVIAIEFNPVFVRNLRAAVPKATIIEGCASKMPQYMDELGIERENVGAVVSGLPLLMMPKDLCRDVFDAIAQTLVAGKPYVQFTYSERAWRRFEPPGFRPSPSRKVWLNFPPAVVLPFTRAS